MTRSTGHTSFTVLALLLAVLLLFPAVALAAGTGQGSGAEGSQTEPVASGPAYNGSDDAGSGTQAGTTEQPATATQTGTGVQTGTAGSGSGEASADAAITQLRARIGYALQKRARRYEAATSALERTRARLEGLADVVEKAGGDVTQARTRLRECAELLVQSREQERTATRLFRGIADEEDRRQAFVQARVQARNAVQTMTQARIRLREAADLLEDEIEDITQEDASE